MCMWGGVYDVSLGKVTLLTWILGKKSVGEEVESKELLVETKMGRDTMENNMGILRTDLK